MPKQNAPDLLEALSAYVSSKGSQGAQPDDLINQFVDDNVDRYMVLRKVQQGLSRGMFRYGEHFELVSK